MSQFTEVYQRIAEFAEQYARSTNFPGMALALTDREQLLHVATYGLADVERQLPVRPETLFEIGSISKSFTCMALLQLQDEGKLDIHAPVTNYLPWFAVQSRYAPITIHHLMSHTAGIMSGADPAPTSRYTVHLLRTTQTAYAPGEHFHYSNVAYQALGYLLEELEGKPYAEIIRTRILEPLGMQATEPVILNQMRSKLAVGYNPLYDDRPLTPAGALTPATWLECGAGDGSISSTAADMAIYLRLLLNEGQNEEPAVLSHANYQLMTRKVIEMDEDKGEYYGYGLMLGEQDGYATVRHTGDMVGYRSIMLGDVKHGIGVIVLLNGPGSPTPIARTALRLLRAAVRGESLPDVPALPAPTVVENAGEYVGVYNRPMRPPAELKSLEVEQDGNQLVLLYNDERIVLERLYAMPDLFYADHPAFALFPLQFVRENGVVVELAHGEDWYMRMGYARGAGIMYPVNWQQLTGHYRSYNSWFTNFRVVLRKGRLYIIDPSGIEQQLAPAEENTFRVGDPTHSPEYLRFDTLINEQMQRAICSGAEFYRTFTS